MQWCWATFVDARNSDATFTSSSRSRCLRRRARHAGMSGQSRLKGDARATWGRGPGEKPHPDSKSAAWYFDCRVQSTSTSANASSFPTASSIPAMLAHRSPLPRRGTVQGDAQAVSFMSHAISCPLGRSPPASVQAGEGRLHAAPGTKVSPNPTAGQRTGGGGWGQTGRVGRGGDTCETDVLKQSRRACQRQNCHKMASSGSTAASSTLEDALP